MPEQTLAEEIAGMLVRIEANWQRETSGPGSRFEGMTMERAQADAVLRYIGEHIAQAIERQVCEPGGNCADRFCPDCIRHAQAIADADLARKIGAGQ